MKSKDGEVYEGVHVVLVLEKGGAGQSRETSAAGEFLFEAVAPGPFSLSFLSPGFEQQAVSGVLQPGESYVVPSVVLAVKETVSNVQVSAETQIQIAEQQIHIEEQQRVLGVLPNYYVSYDPHPVPLTTKQKFKLAGAPMSTRSTGS